MKRTFLTDLGITDSETMKKIIDYHQGVVQDLKDELLTANADLKTAKNDLKTANKTIEDLKSTPVVNNDSSEDWKQKYETLASTATDKDGKTYKELYDALKSDFDTYKTDVETEKTVSAKRTAARQVLKSLGANDEDLDTFLLDKLDYNKIELDDGKIKDVKIFDDYKERFKRYFGTITTEGVNPANPPVTRSGGVNPFAKATFNLQMQTELFRKDPTLARKLAGSAGIELPT